MRWDSERKSFPFISVTVVTVFIYVLLYNLSRFFCSFFKILFCYLNTLYVLISVYYFSCRKLTIVNITISYELHTIEKIQHVHFVFFFVFCFYQIHCCNILIFHIPQHLLLLFCWCVFAPTLYVYSQALLNAGL